MNKTLQFKMSERLIMGNGAVADLPEVVKGLGKKVLIVTDQGIVEAGIARRVTSILRKAGTAHSVFDGVKPDPELQVVRDGAEVAKECGCDVIVGLGGGSPLDIAKVVAVLMTNTGSLEDYVGVDRIATSGLKTVMVPTTAGTGSEVTPIAVLSDKKQHLKKGIVSDHLYPDVALIDPMLTVTLPAAVTAYTGIDALTHAIEAYTNKYSQPFIDTFALEAIRLIARNLRRAVDRGHDLDARYSMSLASLYGGMCLGAVNTAAVHALAYPLGGMFNVPHGVANSLLLPHVMEFNGTSLPQRFAEIAIALGVESDGHDVGELARQSVETVRAMCREVGIVSQLRSLNVPKEAIDDMAAGAMKVTRLLNNNPREVTLDDARRIYQSAY